MGFDFDTDVNKFGINSVKWEFTNYNGKLEFNNHAHAKNGETAMLPMWVADMDFACAPPILEALQARIERGVLGYAAPTESYYEAIINWVARRYGRSIEKEWIVTTPGTVPALNMLIQTLIEPGDKVLIQKPVYYPFFDAIENNGGEIVSNTLVLKNGRYHMDFEDLAEKTADPAVKVAVLCSPHNPIGWVWSDEELHTFGQICLTNDVLVISDEVHCDLLYPGTTFTTFPNLDETFVQNSIVLMAPNKSFNIAGLRISNVIIPNKVLRERYDVILKRNGMKGANIMGLVATEAAYNLSEDWLTEVMDYIVANADFMQDYLATHLPQLKFIRPNGTYLAWVDFRALGLSAEVRQSMIFDKAKVFLDEGELFGPEGEGFERFNLACSRATLAEALERIKKVIEELE